MKICVITPRYPPTVEGGGEISIQLLAEHLFEADWVDEIIVYSFDGDSTDIINGVKVKRIINSHKYMNEISNIISYYNIREHISDIENYDIIHSYNMKLHPMSGYLSTRSGTASVATLNSYGYIPERKIGMGLLRPKQAIYKYFKYDLLKNITLSWKEHIDIFISLSDCIKEVYSDNGFHGQEIYTIPNMIDPKLLKSNSKIKNNICSEEKNILYIGSIKETKGVRYLIESIEHLPYEYKLLIVGSGNRKDDIEDQVKSLGLEDRITIESWVEYNKTSELYSQADIFVHPGIWPEPFGRTLIEAMQHGLPVVATNRGAAPEIIPQSELLCEPKSSRSLAESIQLASNNYEEYSKENRRHVLRNYSPQNVTNKYKKMYEYVSSKG